MPNLYSHRTSLPKSLKLRNWRTTNANTKAKYEKYNVADKRQCRQYCVVHCLDTVVSCICCKLLWDSYTGVREGKHLHRETGRLAERSLARRSGWGKRERATDGSPSLMEVTPGHRSTFSPWTWTCRLAIFVRLFAPARLSLSLSFVLLPARPSDRHLVPPPPTTLPTDFPSPSAITANGPVRLSSLWWGVRSVVFLLSPHLSSSSFRSSSSSFSLFSLSSFYIYITKAEIITSSSLHEYTLHQFSFTPVATSRRENVFVLFPFFYPIRPLGIFLCG